MKTYKEHYNICKNKFGCHKTDISKLTINDNLYTEAKYMSLVWSLREKVEHAFENKEMYYTGNFRNSIKDTLKLPEVHLIHELFYNQLATNFFSSHFTANRVQICTSFNSQADLIDQWCWHYDDVSDYHVKLFIYLSDVKSVNDAPFCYAVDDHGEPIKLESSKIKLGERDVEICKKAPAYAGSPLPQEYVDLINADNSNKSVLGETGKCFLFSPNIVHRATIPDENHYRTVLVYHYHPSTTKSPLFDSRKLELLKNYRML